jgi:beta-lactamase regulating signal transducer with metallopeptidase domain
MNSWIIENLGWTLLHSLWQISFVALILFVALRVLRESVANFRYLASISALILSLILPVATFIYLSTAAKTEVKPINQPLPNLNIEPSLQSANPQPVQNEIPLSLTNSPKIVVTSSSPNILLILVGFWLIGVMIFSIRLAGGIWTVRRYKTRKVSAVENCWQEKFDELCESLQIRQKVKFLKSQMVEIPMVIGWLKPVVLVPASAFLQISPKELETILIHELIHIKRRDYLVNFVQSLVEILFFFHPGVWWMSAQIRSEREFAVDELVTQTFETKRFIYAKALANLEESRATAPILAMGADGGNLMKRIEKILNGSRKINSKNVSIWSAVFAVTFVLGLTVGVYWIKASAKTTKKIAIVFKDVSGDFSDEKREEKSYQHLIDLQKKYEIPATWILESGLIENLKQSGTAPGFFRQAKENRSDFIINVPNINYTIFINGDDEYIDLWKKRVQFVEESMVNNGQKLTKFSINYKSQIPQEMENALIKKGLKETEIPFQTFFSSGFQFSFVYEKDCARIENKLSCKEQTEEKRKEMRRKYLQYLTEMFDFIERYSQEKFGEIAPQLLVFPANDLTRDTSDEIVQMLKNKGYEFVQFDEVTANEKFNNLNKMSREHLDFFKKQWDLESKYLDKPFTGSKDTNEALKKAQENLRKNFNVEVTTKDLKPKPQ